MLSNFGTPSLCEAGAGPSAGLPTDNRAGHIHHVVDHRAHAYRPLVAAALRRRDQSSDQRSFLVGQITRIAPATMLVAGALCGRPHAERIDIVPMSAKITTNSDRYSCSWMAAKAPAGPRGATCAAQAEPWP